MATKNLGRIGFVDKGAWSATTTYNKLDVVQVKDYGSFYSKKDGNKNSNPVTDSVNWAPVASGAYAKAQGDYAKHEGDKAATLSGKIADLEDRKANKDGHYDGMTVFGAEQVISPDGVVDKTPYIYRTSAGDTSISNGLARIEKIKGCSIMWNQLARVIGVKNSNISPIGQYGVSGFSTSSYFTFSIPAGSTIVVKCKIKSQNGVNAAWRIYANYGYSVGGVSIGNPSTGSNDYEEIALFLVNPSVAITNFAIINSAAITNEDVVSVKDFTISNLTQMFGAGNEPTTYEEYLGKKPVVADEYAYNEGEVVSVNVDGLKTTGFNQWDEQWELGAVDYTNGNIVQRTDTIRSKNPIKILGGKKYYFGLPVAKTFYCAFYDAEMNFISGLPENYAREVDVPERAQYCKFSVTPTYGNTYMNDICINLSWSGYRNGEYEPYEEHNINIPIKDIVDGNGDVLFPNGLLSAGSVRDEVTTDKAVKRIGKVKLKDLTFGYLPTAGNIPYFFAVIPNITLNETPVLTNIYSFGGYSYYSDSSLVNNRIYKIVTTDWKNRIAIVDTRYNTVEDLKAHFTDNDYLCFELATPVEVNFSDVPQTFGNKLNLTYHVDDFGTEEFTTDAHMIASVAHETFYMTNLRDKIRNIDGNTDSGALMNGSVDNLLSTLGAAIGGTFTKTWDSVNKKWTFSFTPNAATLSEEGGDE